MLFVFKLHIIGRNIKLIKFKIDNKFNGIYIYMVIVLSSFRAGLLVLNIMCLFIGFVYWNIRSLFCPI